VYHRHSLKLGYDDNIVYSLRNAATRLYSEAYHSKRCIRDRLEILGRGYKSGENDDEFRWPRFAASFVRLFKTTAALRKVCRAPDAADVDMDKFAIPGDPSDDAFVYSIVNCQDALQKLLD